MSKMDTLIVVEVGDDVEIRFKQTLGVCISNKSTRLYLYFRTMSQIRQFEVMLDVRKKELLMKA